MENSEKKKRYYEKLALDTGRSLRYHFSAARKSAAKRNIDFCITEDTIVTLWKEQQGKCKLSKIDMTLTHGTSTATNPTKISIDRIDNQLGYVEGNIQLIIWQLNNAKSVWSNQQLIDTCKAVASHA
jgi:hypothetical protein